jgi:hypothetical protein
MTMMIRNAVGEIKTFMEAGAGTVLESGETMEEIAAPFTTYAQRLRLCVDGRSGELIRAAASSGTVTVTVDCPDEEFVGLNINGLVESVPLVGGMGALILSTEVPGTFVISPADRTKYCAAGEAVCVVEVTA